MTGKQNHPRDLSAIGGDPSRQRGAWKHIGIAPQDELEAMMAAQILAVHDAAMTCYRSAAEAREAPARRDDLVIADRLARSLAALVATERRYYRGKARRTITVDYVRVEPDAGAPAAPVGGIKTLLGI
jgi:hypothetical protein